LSALPDWPWLQSVKVGTGTCAMHKFGEGVYRFNKEAIFDDASLEHDSRAVVNKPGVGFRV